MSRLRRLWPPAASALLALLAFPPFNLGLLVFVALAPWLASLRKLDGRAAWRSGYTFGLVYGLGQLFWIAQFVGKWTDSVVLGLLPWLVAAALMALYFGLAGVLIQRCWQRGWPWLIPVAWAGVEVFRSYIPIFAFPWGLLATPLWPYPPLIQAAHYGTIYLISAWVILPSVMLAGYLSGEAPLKDGLRKQAPLGTAFLLVLIVSLLRMNARTPSVRTSVVAGQPGVDMAFGDPNTEAARLGRNVNGIFAVAHDWQARLLVLPEGISESNGSFPPQTPFRIDPQVPVLFGGRRGVQPAYQSAFAFDGRWRYADKTRLVIFGEFVPGRELFPFLGEVFRLPSGDLSASREGVKSVEVGGLRVGPVICFEGLFPDIAWKQARNGSRLLAVMSIDDWYMGTTAPDQLRAASIWRAVETGLPLVRSASLGYSLVVDDHGAIVAEAPLGHPYALHADVDVPTGPQGFAAAPVFPLLALVISIFLLFIRSFRPNVTLDLAANQS